MIPTLIAPFSGRVVSLADIADPVFSAQLLGPGLGIEPTNDNNMTVLAPADGRITKVFPHAYVIEIPVGTQQYSILIHLGLDTVRLKGEGLRPLVQADQEVSAGQVIASWDPGTIAEQGYSATSPIVLLEGTSEQIETLASPGTLLSVGQELLRLL
ncbi:MAG: PTS glucose transporter subunit IIA [Actinomycetaceae bacterium]|nr:PTS glucose transporter subunit IIA [Actinomycetaceae bacterium]